MKKFALSAILICTLGGCYESHTPIDQSAFFIRGTKDDVATDKITAFLKDRGYETKTVASSPGYERWYKNSSGTALVEIEAGTNHCISFFSYMNSGSNDPSAAQHISQDFLEHFGQTWSVRRHEACP